MGFKKMIIGEPVPDKDDPKYKEKHEKTVEAGMNFAKAVKLDKAAACVQRFATNHTKVFLALVFGFVLFSVALNLWRMSNAVTYRTETSSAIERQEKELHLKRHHQDENAMREKYKKMYENARNDDNPKEIEEYEAFGKD